MAKAKLENVVRRLTDMGYNICTDKVTKNGVELTAIINNCGDMCPTCYFENVIKDDVSDEVAAERIRGVFERTKRKSSISRVGSMTYLKSLSVNSLEARICAKSNAGKNVITIPFLDDLEIYPIITFTFGEEKAVIKITGEIAKNIPWLSSLSMLDICTIAMKNSFKKTKQFDYTNMMIRTLINACADGKISKTELNHAMTDVLEKDVDSVMKILTNDAVYGGAIAIADTAALKRLSKEFDDDFYIIPSSVHESATRFAA